MEKKKYRKSVVVVFFLVLSLLCLVLLELGARCAYQCKSEIGKILGIKPRLVLDEYEIPDPEHPENWKLKPGYCQTLENLKKEKERTGHLLGAQQLEKKLQKSKETHPKLKINQQGFRGPEIDSTHSHLRILTIGDSCTFGLSGTLPYPRIVEQRLRERGWKVEVINGGVEGYGTYNVLCRIRDFMALKPEITTIYLGWNDLFAEKRYSGIEKYLYTFRLFHKAWERAWGNRARAFAQYSKAKNPNPKAAEVRNLKGYIPSFLPKMEEIISHISKVSKCVVLMTLPSLFISDEAPSAKALKIGHLPYFTNNPYVLAKMVEQYNECLRKLAKKHHLLLIDLQKWSRKLSPRDEYFIDSVHLTEDAQKRLGGYIADQLMKLRPKMKGLR